MHCRAECCSQDAVAIWRRVLSVEQPPIVLVGHSMGGAVAVRCAASKVHAAMLHLVVAQQQLLHDAQGSSGHCNLDFW